MENQLKHTFFSHHGKISNFDLISSFKSYFEEVDDKETIATNKRLFKKLVNKLAQVQVENNVKYLVLRDRYRQELGLLSDADGLSASILKAISQSSLPKPVSTADDVEEALFPTEVPSAVGSTTLPDSSETDTPHFDGSSPEEQPIYEEIDPLTTSNLEDSDKFVDKKETLINDVDPEFVSPYTASNDSSNLDNKNETLIDDIDPKFLSTLDAPSLQVDSMENQADIDDQVSLGVDSNARYEVEHAGSVDVVESLNTTTIHEPHVDVGDGGKLETLIDDVDPRYIEADVADGGDDGGMTRPTNVQSPEVDELPVPLPIVEEAVLISTGASEPVEFAVPAVPPHLELPPGNAENTLQVSHPSRSSSTGRSVSELPSPAGSTTSSVASLSTLDGSSTKVSVRDRAEQFHRDTADLRVSRTPFGMKAKRKQGDDNFDSASLTSSSQINYWVSESERKWMLLSSRCDYQEMAKALHKEPTLAGYADIINGQTALHWAAKKGKLELVKLLAGTYKVDPNIRSHAGYTPLHMASMFDRKDVIDLLITTYRANSNIQDYTGRLPQDYRKNAMNTQKLSIYQLYDQVKRGPLYGNSQLCKNPSSMNQFTVCADFVSSVLLESQESNSSIPHAGGMRVASGTNNNSSYDKMDCDGDGYDDDSGLRSYDQEPVRLRVHSSVNLGELNDNHIDNGPHTRRKERGVSVTSIHEAQSPHKRLPTSYGLSHSASFSSQQKRPVINGKGGRPFSEHSSAGHRPHFQAGWEIPEENVSPMHTITSEAVEARLGGSPIRPDSKSERSTVGRVFSLKPVIGHKK